MVASIVVFLIKHQRKKPFEWTIVVLMTCKYIIYNLSSFEVIKERVEHSPDKEVQYIMWWTIKKTLGPICRWIYVSQYLKTCYLTSGIVNKALLLLKRHQTVIEDEYHQKTMRID